MWVHTKRPPSRSQHTSLGARCPVVSQHIMLPPAGATCGQQRQWKAKPPQQHNTELRRLHEEPEDLGGARARLGQQHSYQGGVKPLTMIAGLANLKGGCRCLLPPTQSVGLMARSACASWPTSMCQEGVPNPFPFRSAAASCTAATTRQLLRFPVGGQSSAPRRDAHGNALA